MKNLEEIKAILGQVKSLVKEKYHVSELGIFGDYLKGEVQENSEVNILIDYTEPPSLLDLVDIEIFLSAVKLIEIIGEAVKNIPDEVRVNYPNIPWKNIAGMRDKLVHEYWAICD